MCVCVSNQSVQISNRPLNTRESISSDFLEQLRNSRIELPVRSRQNPNERIQHALGHWAASLEQYAMRLVSSINIDRTIDRPERGPRGGGPLRTYLLTFDSKDF